MADEPIQPQAETTTPEPQAQPQVESQPTTTESQPQAPAEPQWQGVLDYAKQQGVELPYPDDAAALSNLISTYRQAQQRNPYAELGQRWAPHAAQIQDYLRQQAQPQPKGPNPWEPPTFKKEWLQQVERDPDTGMLRAKAGYDPGLPEKVQAYADWRDNYLDQPEQVLGPMVEQRARAIAREEMSSYQAQALAQSLVQADASWIFDANRQLTPAGQLYAQTIRQLDAAGMKDVRQSHSIARSTVENAVLKQKLATLQPAPAGNQGTAAVPASAGGTVTRPGSSGVAGPAASQKGLSLREQLTRRLDQVEV